MKNRFVGIATGLLLCFFLVSLVSAQDLWEVKKARTSSLDISDLWMADENVGWIITGDNKIYKTTDGCVTFTIPVPRRSAKCMPVVPAQLTFSVPMR
jgi:photosystem II stability/assembly factor-like uncharacterized protein